MMQLYDRAEVNFDHNGHALADVSNDVVTWQINSKYTLTFNYPIFSPFGTEIKQESIITVPVPDGVQPFRVYSIQKSMGVLSVTAYHVFWDLQSNWIEDINIVNEDGASALQHILSHTQFENNFTSHSQLNNKATARIVRMNAISALIGTDDNTFLSRWGGEFEWDGFAFNVVGQIGKDRGVVFRNGKNLTGYTATENSEKVVTRIQPKGYNGLLLPEKYVDSPLINNYVMPKIGEIEYQDIKAKDENTVTDDDTAVPLDQAYDMLREAAKKEFEVNKLDQPTYTFQLNVILLEQTEEYKDSMFTRVYPGDTATFIHDQDGLNVKARLTGYTWAPSQEQYLTVTFDSAQNLRPSPDLSQKISNISNKVDTIDSDVVTKAAGGANSITWSSNEPSGDAKEGDLWYQQVGDKIIMWVYQDGKWIIGVGDATGADIRKDVDNAMGEIADAKSEAETANQKAQQAVDDFNDAKVIIDGDIASAKSDAANALNNVTVIDSKLTQLSDTTTARLDTLDNGYQLVLDTVDDMSIGATNLLKNSKFDDDMNGWRIWCPQGMGTSTVQVNETGGGGDWSRQAVYLAKIVKTEADKNNQFGIAQDNIPVEPNTEYVLQLFNDGAAPITVQHGNGKDDTYESSVVSDHKVVWKFKTSADTYLTNIYIGFNSGQVGTAWISMTKLEKGNKPTDWSLSPFDTATQTQITVMQGLIDQKVSNDQYQSDKTQTANLISQTVKDVSGLKTEVNQVSDDVQILATTGGQKNLVYNSSYANSAEGWNMFDKVGYLSTVPASSYNGSPGFGVNISGKGATTWTQFGESKHYNLPQSNVDTANTYSASAMVKMYNDSDSTAKLGATIAYFDKNGTRISGWKDMLINYSQKLVWTEVKFENLPVPSGAQTVAIQFQAYGPKVHGMITQPMVVFGPKIGQYQPDVVNSSELDVSINGIQTTVTNGLNDLTTKVTQTDSAWQAAVGNLGKANLVVNSELNDGATGWNKGLWYTSENQTSMHNGTVAMGVNQTGLSADTWTTAISPTVNTITSSNRVFSFDVWCLIYSLEGSSTTMATLEFVDKSGKRVQASDIHADGSVKTWQKLSVSNVSAPAGATGYRIQYHLHGTGGHVMYSQPMLVGSPTNASVYQPDSVSKADITLAVDNIHLGVKNADGSTATFNMNSNTILLDAAKIMINGTTSIKDATISSAKIASLSADKITAGTLNASKVNVVNLNAANIVTGTIKGANLSINLNTGEVVFQKGRIHSTTNNVDVNIDQGYLTVANDTNRVMLKNGEMQFVSPNLFDVSDSPYLSISNKGAGQSWYGASVIGRDYIALANKANSSNMFSSNFGGEETFAGIAFGKSDTGWEMTKVGGAERGIQLSAGSELKNVSMVGGSPDIRIGVQGDTVSHHGNRIAINGEYVHIYSARYHTGSGSANLIVATDGALTSSTSASKYKLNISKFTDNEQAHALLAINAKTWYDKAETESIVKTMNEGFDEEAFGTPRLKPYLGFIAEDFDKAGLETLVSRNENGELESINYDRISALEHLNVQELFSRVLQLEQDVYKLRSDQS